MKRKYYHATSKTNQPSIQNSGIKKGIDGVVYLTEKPEQAAIFLILRGFEKSDIVIFEVALNNKDVYVSFDHSKEFFGFDAFCYANDIESDKITNIFEME